MNPRALPAVVQATVLSAQPLTTGNLLADCERWCRDNLPPRQSRPLTAVPALPGRSLMAAGRSAA